MSSPNLTSSIPIISIALPVRTFLVPSREALGNRRKREVVQISLRLIFKYNFFPEFLEQLASFSV